MFCVVFGIFFYIHLEGKWKDRVGVGSFEGSFFIVLFFRMDLVFSLTFVFFIYILEDLG